MGYYCFNRRIMYWMADNVERLPGTVLDLPAGRYLTDAMTPAQVLHFLKERYVAVDARTGAGKTTLVRQALTNRIATPGHKQEPWMIILFRCSLEDYYLELMKERAVLLCSICMPMPNNTHVVYGWRTVCLRRADAEQYNLIILRLTETCITD